MRQPTYPHLQIERLLSQSGLGAFAEVIARSLQKNTCSSEFLVRSLIDWGFTVCRVLLVDDARTQTLDTNERKYITSNRRTSHALLHCFQVYLRQ